jgi:hypothetical protein
MARSVAALGFVRAVGLAVGLRVPAARLTNRGAGRMARSVAALGFGRCSQIADANVVMLFDCDAVVRRGSAAALWRQKPVGLPRRMGPDGPKAPQKVVSLGSLMLARAARRFARAGDRSGFPAGRFPPSRSAAVAAPQPLPQVVQEPSPEGRLQQSNLVPPILVGPANLRDLLVWRRCRDADARRCRYHRLIPSPHARATTSRRQRRYR